MNQAALEAMKQHAAREYPRESCGVLISERNREVYVECRNISDNKMHFKMSPEDYASAEDRGEIIGIVHSHPDYPVTPSQADSVACEASGMPWYIVEVRNGVPGAIERVQPYGYKAPLINRQFYPGVLDCYKLGQDLFERERGIILKDFERSEEWFKRDGTTQFYLEKYEEAGFVKVMAQGEIDYSKLQPFDMILMQYRSKRVNHAGFFLGSYKLKEETVKFVPPRSMLHHVMGRLSQRVIYGGYWEDITQLVVRYAGLGGS